MEYDIYHQSDPIMYRCILSVYQWISTAPYIGEPFFHLQLFKRHLRRLTHRPIFNAFPSTEEKDALLEQTAAPPEDDYSDLYEAIDRLPEKLRVTVILFYFRDMDTTSVAQILGIPPGTVKSRLHKARQLLKEVLKSETDLPF